jgi:hypothetical protein
MKEIKVSTDIKVTEIGDRINCPNCNAIVTHESLVSSYAHEKNKNELYEWKELHCCWKCETKFIINNSQ